VKIRDNKAMYQLQSLANKRLLLHRDKKVAWDRVVVDFHADSQVDHGKNSIHSTIIRVCLNWHLSNVEDWIRTVNEM